MQTNTVILKWNPAISSYSMLRFLQAIEWGDAESNWSIYEHDKVKAGDRFFMLKVGIGTCGIVASGEITSNPVVDEDWSGRGRKVYYSDYICDFMVNPEALPILESNVLEDDIPGFDWKGGHSGAVLDEERALVLQRLFDKYLHDNAVLFAERMQLIERRNMCNDQLYMDDALFDKLQGEQS